MDLEKFLYGIRHRLLRLTSSIIVKLKTHVRRLVGFGNGLRSARRAGSSLKGMNLDQSALLYCHPLNFHFPDPNARLSPQQKQLGALNEHSI